MEGLYVYPGHDIQLAWRPVRARKVKLQVLYRSINPNPGNNGLDYIVTDVTDQALITIATAQKTAKYDQNTKEISLLSSHFDEVATNYLDIEYIPPGQTVPLSTAQIKINVHKELLETFPGNNILNIPVDNRLFHCQLSIFGRFDTIIFTEVEDFPGEFVKVETPATIEADITGHGFVDFQIADTPVHCQLDNDKRGKIMGTSVGQNTIKISSHNGIYDIKANMVNFYGDPQLPLDPATIRQPNQVLQQISNPQAAYRKNDKFTYSDDPAERLNILFLSEGYTDAHAPIFDDLVNNLVNDIFGSYPPFHLLRHRFNIWKAFLPSPEPGWTYQHFVSTVYNTYLNRNTYLNNPNQLEGLIEVKNTNLGLIYSPVRLSDQYIYNSPREDIIIGDRRRYPLELDWTKAILRHIWSFTDGKSMNGSTWYQTLNNNTDAKYTKDFGLVVIFVNATNDWREGAFAEGANYGSFIVVPAPVAGDTLLKRSGLKGAILSDFPVLSSADRHALIDYDYLKAVFLRFFTKRFGLGYEFNDFVNINGARFASFFGNNTNSADSIGYVLGNSYPTNFSTAVKWNLLDRIVKSERILDIVQVSAIGATKVSIKLKVASKSVKTRWKKEAAQKEPVWLREFRVSPDRAESRVEDERNGADYHTEEFLDFSNSNYYHIPRNHWTYNPDVQTRDPELFVFDKCIVKGFDGVDVIILEADINLFASFVITLTPAEIENFLRSKLSASGFFNGLLYKPIVKNNAVEKLIRTDVRVRLESNIVYNLNILPPPAPPTSGLSTTSLPKGREIEYPPPTLVKTGASLHAQPLTGNKFPYLVVGSYRGAYYGAIAAYRPTGACLMRNFDKQYGIYSDKLCFVCQYLIVSYVDPAQLETLEKDYPDFA